MSYIISSYSHNLLIQLTREENIDSTFWTFKIYTTKFFSFFIKFLWLFQFSIECLFLNLLFFT